ncbi:hypothetical protein [Streptomyces sp. MAR4 CNX-425]|uniref:hypothetical protein n=1 Tax=Streptomyces sp. MAR4 CNX-425 TaxID=3406343 RepID=UPI003B509288
MTDNEHGWSHCSVSMPIPENWIALDLGAPDTEAWALSTAQGHLGDQRSAVLHEAFAADIVSCTAAAVARNAISAAVLAPRQEPILALLQLRELHLAPREYDLAHLREAAAHVKSPLFRPPELTTVDLPVGTAVREHRLEPESIGDGTAQTVEGVAYYVLPDQHPDSALELLMRWNATGLGELLCALADEVALTLRLS